MASLWIATPAAPMPTIELVLVGLRRRDGLRRVHGRVLQRHHAEPRAARASSAGCRAPAGPCGYFGGLVSLCARRRVDRADAGDTGTTLLGLEPLFTLDAAAREGDRIVGPFSAVWYVVFMIPFFLFVPDARADAARTTAGRRRPSCGTRSARCRRSPSMLLFLIARMIYTDGLTAIFTFGGIYGASVFGWGALELGMFGIVLTLVGAFGALIGGVLDDRIGAEDGHHRARWSILLIGAVGILSVDKTHVLFVIDVEPEGRRAPRRSPRPASACSSPSPSSSASSRRRCRRRAARCWRASRRADKITQYFGLFAFSGKVTAFLAPLLVAFVTQATRKPAHRHVGDLAVPPGRHRADAATAHAATGGLARGSAASHVWA